MPKLMEYYQLTVTTTLLFQQLYLPSSLISSILDSHHPKSTQNAEQQETATAKIRFGLQKIKTSNIRAMMHQNQKTLSSHFISVQPLFKYFSSKKACPFVLLFSISTSIHSKSIFFLDRKRLHSHHRTIFYSKHIYVSPLFPRKFHIFSFLFNILSPLFSV